MGLCVDCATVDKITYICSLALEQKQLWGLDFAGLSWVNLIPLKLRKWAGSLELLVQPFQH